MSDSKHTSKHYLNSISRLHGRTVDITFNKKPGKFFKFEDVHDQFMTNINGYGVHSVSCYEFRGIENKYFTEGASRSRILTMYKSDLLKVLSIERVLYELYKE